VTCDANARARAVTAAGRSWHGVLGACLDQLDPLPQGANLGVVYLGESLAPVADEVVRALRQRTGFRSWVGACGAGVLGGPAAGGTDGLAVMVAALPPGSFRVLAAPARAVAGGDGLLLAHAEMGQAEPAALPAELAGALGARTLVGALIAAGRSPVQVAGGVIAGGAACLGFAADQPVHAGLATAGSPLGPGHKVTGALDGEIFTLDDRPAVAVLADEVGELFRRSGRRFADNIWVAERSQASRAGTMMRMRRIVGVDEARGSLRLEGGRPGAEVRLMRPDPAGSLARVRELARAQVARLRGRPPVAGIYLASRHRGRGLFGPRVDEVAILREELGRLPLVGLVTDAEIFDGAVHEAAGVLVLIG
jgi:small ligand-binding sensory domain FIST